MSAPFVARRRVEFADTDLAGIVHFARFLIFMETAEHRWRESLGIPVHGRVDGVPLGWPRVAVSCDYKSPARFGDELVIEVRPHRIGTSSLTVACTVRRDDGEGGTTLLAEGTMTSVCCRLEPTVKPVPLPEALVEALGGRTSGG